LIATLSLAACGMLLGLWPGSTAAWPLTFVLWLLSALLLVMLLGLGEARQQQYGGDAGEQTHLHGYFLKYGRPRPRRLGYVGGAACDGLMFICLGG
jgi:hypothetical protein